MEQIKFAFKEILDKRFLSVIMGLQLVVIVFFLYLCISKIIYFQEGSKRLEDLKNSGAYINSDSTNDDQMQRLFESEEESTQKAQELYHYIKQQEACKSFSCFSYCAQLNSGLYVDQYYTETELFENFAIRFIEGEGNLEYREGSSDPIPLIVGYDLRKEYKLGQTYKENDFVTGEPLKYKVVGILEQNSTIPSLYNIGETVSLDQAFIQPILERDLADLATLDMAISSTIIFTQDQTILDDFVLKSSELDLFELNYSTIEENIRDYAEKAMEEMKWLILIIAIMLAFTGLSLIVSLNNLFEKKKREFAIHMMYGASRIRVLSRVIFYVAFLYLPAIGVLFIKYGVNHITGLVLLGIVILILISVFPTYLRLLKLDICQVKNQGELYEESY